MLYTTFSADSIGRLLTLKSSAFQNLQYNQISKYLIVYNLNPLYPIIILALKQVVYTVHLPWARL